LVQLDDDRPEGLQFGDDADSAPVCASVPIDLIEPDPAHVRRDWSGVYVYIAPDITDIDEPPVEIEMVERHETGYQHLEQLARSINRCGMLQPIIARAHPCDSKAVKGVMMVISGHRRLEAARLAGLTHVPVILRPRRHSDGQQSTLIQLIENVQRQNLSHVDQARALYALQLATGARSTEMAIWIGVTSQYVGDHLRLLRYPMLVHAVNAGTISFSSAREIMRLPTEAAERITAEALAGRRYELSDIGRVRSNLRRDDPASAYIDMPVLDCPEPRGNTSAVEDSISSTTDIAQVPIDALGAIVSRLDGTGRAILGEVLAYAAQQQWSCAQLAVTLRLML